MKLRLALFAALSATAGLTVAQTTVIVPANSYVIEHAHSVRSGPTGLTRSPNPNKAQNSDMRTQAGVPAYYVYPTAEYPRGVFMYPHGTYMQPTAGMSIPSPTGLTHTPNPNKTQNSGVPQQQ